MNTWGAVLKQPIVGVGLIGCGAIAAELAVAIDNGSVKNASLLVVFDPEIELAENLSQELDSHPVAAGSFAEFLEHPGLHLVVEAASQAAVRAHAVEVLSASIDLMIMSSGALTDVEIFRSISEVAERNGCRAIIPSGAIGGIDAIRAVRQGLEEVVITTRKPPHAYKGAPGFKAWETKELNGRQVLYEGSVLEAVQLFPANVNVAATLSLAGIGPDKTTIRVLADPAATRNTHEIFARGTSGTFRFTMENVPHPRNPKTSYLAVLSAIETLRAACESGVRIGS